MGNSRYNGQLALLSFWALSFSSFLAIIFQAFYLSKVTNWNLKSDWAKDLRLRKEEDDIDKKGKAVLEEEVFIWEQGLSRLPTSKKIPGMK